MDLQGMGLMDVAVLGLKLGTVLVAPWVLLWGCLYLFMWMAIAVQTLSALCGRLLRRLWR